MCEFFLSRVKRGLSTCERVYVVRFTTRNYEDLWFFFLSHIYEASSLSLCKEKGWVCLFLKEKTCLTMNVKKKEKKNNKKRADFTLHDEVFLYFILYYSSTTRFVTFFFAFLSVLSTFIHVFLKLLSNATLWKPHC